MKHKTAKVCGSDGEKAIQNGFRHAQSFKDSVWLTCMIHARDNCKRKLEEVGVKPDTKTRILNEIYGCELEHEGVHTRKGGLVDLETREEFDEELEKTSWDELEVTDTENPPKFKEWFIRYKAAECKDAMLPPVHRLAGLGDPPRQFTTNDVESENVNIKREVDWQKKTWDDAANHLHARVLAHYDELSRGVYQEGRYRLSERFKNLEKEPYEWNAMEVKDRRRHVEKAHLRAVAVEGSLSVQTDESGIQGISIGDLKSAWEQAGDILSCEENIVIHPGNAMTTVVFEENEVYTVCKDGNQFSCDSRCSRYKHFDRLFCQHTVAAAERNGSLVAFVGWINTKIATKSAEMLNAALNASCRGAGEKKSKRKGANNRLAGEVGVLQQQSRSVAGSSAGLPQSSVAVFPMGSGSACASNRIALPPLTALQLSTQERQPFTVTFRQGLIKRCCGCGQEFSANTRNPPMM